MTAQALRILLADDNAVDRKLSLRVLAQLGYEADVASNGAEALQALQRKTYDLLLTDVQMPEMDGTELARRLCERWPPAERPRIVALTAGDAPEDRALCLAAGMDDCLAKPIARARLLEVLGQVPPRTTDSSTEPAIDLAIFTALQQSAGREFVDELLATFLDETPPLLNRMHEALAAQQADTFRRAAHSLKSNAITFGALALGASARELELKGLEQVLAGPAAPLDTLVRENSRAAAALGALRDA